MYCCENYNMYKILLIIITTDRVKKIHSENLCIKRSHMEFKVYIIPQKFNTYFLYKLVITVFYDF